METGLVISALPFAAREAHLAAYHAVEAFIYERTGKPVKTHSGLRSTFARLVKDDQPVDRNFLRFIANTWDLPRNNRVSCGQSRYFYVIPAKAGTQATTGSPLSRG